MKLSLYTLNEKHCVASNEKKNILNENYLIKL